MSLRSKLWVTVGMLCASMAARAEYKEVWNPPEAAQQARHSKHAASAGSGASTSVHREAAAPHKKAAAKPVASSKAKPKATQTSATAHPPVQSKHVEAAAKPRQVAQSNTPQAVSAQPPRELPPILH